MESKKTRNTEKQNLVRNILSKTEHTMSAEDIIHAMPIKVNKTTIYRILDRFAEKGEVHFITGKNGKAYYALCDNCGVSHKIHNHIHFECQECKEVTCQPNTLEVLFRKIERIGIFLEILKCLSSIIILDQSICINYSTSMNIKENILSKKQF